MTSRVWSRIRRAVPPLRTTLIGALAWGLAMAASAGFAIWLADWKTPAKIWALVVLFGCGGMIAFPLGLFLGRLAVPGGRAEARFAAGFLGFGGATIGITALIYAFDYRTYYAEWHAEAFSVTWAFQLMFTTLGALAQFAVLGIRLYFPLGFVALFAAGLWFVRKPR